MSLRIVTYSLNRASKRKMKNNRLKIALLLTIATNCLLFIRAILYVNFTLDSNEIYNGNANLDLNVIEGKNSFPKPNDLLDLKDFKYLITKPPCKRGSYLPSFITLVHSAPNKVEKRMAARQTWSHSDNRTLTYFVMGSVPYPSLQKRIEAEDEKYHDIIQGNFMDTYHNLTYKHTMVLKWFTENCPHVKHLVKLDDDVFVNVPAVHQFLQNYKHKPKFLMGPYRKPGLSARNGTDKWKITYEQRRENWFPEYATGPTIVYSNEYAINAYKETATTPFFWIDDVFFTGFIRVQLNVKIIPIYKYFLNYSKLEKYLNGEIDVAPRTDFLFSDHNLNVDQLKSIWIFIRDDI